MKLILVDVIFVTEKFGRRSQAVKLLFTWVCPDHEITLSVGRILRERKDWWRK